MNNVDFTIGADPEFCCIDTFNQVVPANRYGNGDSELGCDGNGTTFEVRPSPAKNPLKVVSNIQKIFLQHTVRYPDFLRWQWISGAYTNNQPLGGHIHFGTSDKIDGRTGSQILSQYAGSILLLLEGENALKRRVNGGHNYGGFEDFRPQSYGFEYRTPSSWLTHPHMAAAALCLAKTVMSEVLNNKKFSPITYFSPECIDTCNTTEIKRHFPSIWKSVTEMKQYQKFKPHIDLLYYLINSGKNWYPKNDFKQVWGLIDTRIPEKPITLETIWSRAKVNSNFYVNE